MKLLFFPKLAMDGIRKNKRMYAPYIFTGGLMVMIYYILNSLMKNPTLEQMQGGSVIQGSILPLGGWVIAFFSLLFLFYTNSFLIRQRNREFGLYNILGMGKGGIGRIIIWESLFVGVSAILAGLILGVILSKAAELDLMNLLHLDVSYELWIETASIGKTALLYGGIYLLLLISSVIRVWHMRPVELLQSSRVGEKPPKGNFLFALAGLISLGAAYYLAVSIEEPLTAFIIFFFAVLLVIAATYLLFISGSVVYCRILQKNKRYYYKPNHFVSVASMVYRMKRNGAGLASICILLTMVLVMISSTTSLYFGTEDSIHSRYPGGVNVTIAFDSVEGLENENVEQLREQIGQEGEAGKVVNDFRSGEISGLITDTGIVIDINALTEFHLTDYDDVGNLIVLSLEDYNRMAEKQETLNSDECLLSCIRTDYSSDTFALPGGTPYKVKKISSDFLSDGEVNMLIVPTICIVVEDFAAFVEPVANLKADDGNPMMRFAWKYGFDAKTTKEEADSAYRIREFLRSQEIEGKNHIYSSTVESREENREGFYEIYGGLFFLGIMLSVVFLMAAVLIIYYKQISEGYEDQSRFAIMQKVGMTKKDIRRSINSQVLTVFFSPLIFAGLHLAFAFPLLWKLLLLFNLHNRTLIIIVTLASYGVFALFYTVVYKITSNSYYAIVSGKGE